MSKTTELLAHIPAVGEALRRNPERKIRLRVCRIGAECPSCGGAAWIQAKPKVVKGELKFRLPKKPRPECKGAMVPSDSSRKIHAYLKRVMPAWAADLVSF
jgi:hypothetical protein